MTFLKIPLFALAAASFLLAGAGAASAATYAIDGSHSQVLFKASHMNVGVFYGSFLKFSGSFDYDKAAPAKSKVSFTVDAASVFTGSKKRDEHLKSPDFFNAKQFPSIVFQSTRVTASAKGLAVTGKLTLLGTTKTVTLQLDAVGQGNDPWGNFRAGFHGKFTIKRSDFGMKYGIENGSIGDAVELIVAVEGIKKK